MTFESPNMLALYAAATGRQRPLNAARRRCEGCATMRSVGQFQSAESTFCLQCARRNISTPKPTRRRPATESLPEKTGASGLAPGRKAES